MSLGLRPLRAPRWLTGPLDRLGSFVVVIAAGLVLGLQYMTPNKRVIPVLVAITMFGLTWRLDMASGLGILAIALPFPRSTVFGNTNLAFILLLLVIWLLRTTLGQSAPRRGTLVDAPLLALFICYVVSFYNVPSLFDLNAALVYFEVMVGCWLLFLLIAGSVQDERSFIRLLNFQAVSVLLVCLFGVYESMHPGQTFIRGWLEMKYHGQTSGVDLQHTRVGSVFFDYELLCEYCALNFLYVMFRLVRAQSLTTRVVWGGLLLLVLYVLFSTVTRGGLVSLCVGLVYLGWVVRRRLTVVGLATGVGAVVGIVLGMNWYVATFTRTGDLFERLLGSQVKGLVPDSRVTVWPDAWHRIFEHPFIGHGPYYSNVSGGRIYYWPHSLFLYVANNVGFIGLAVFLWLLWRFFQVSRPRTDDLRHGSFAQSYLLMARAQFVVLVVDQIKIEYLRNEVYQFQVWVMLALLVTAHQLTHPPDARGTTRAGAAGAPALRR